MTESNANLIWVVLFRTIQTALESAPTLLCGLFVAGFIRGMISPEAIRRWFTDDPRIGPVRAWFTGLLLPVCSFGVLPVAWELKRVGVSRATVLTFLFAAPLANPFSLLYAYQRLEGVGPIGLAALAFLLVSSFVLLAGIGVLFGLWFPEPITKPDLPPLPASGLHRVGIVGLTVARGTNSGLLLYLMTGLAGAGLLAIIRGGALERAVADRSIAAPLHLAVVSIPFQATSTRGTELVCESLLGGLSVGSVFILYLLGIGLHLGTLIWISASYGIRTLACTLSILVVGSLILGFAVPLSLPSTAPDVIPGCHFFEIEPSGGYQVAKARAMRSTVTNDLGEPQLFLIGACAAIGLFSLAGFVSTCLGDRGTISYVMTCGAKNPPIQMNIALNKSLSAPQITLAGMVLMLLGVWAGLYVYYPPPSELLDQMDGIQVELAMNLKSSPVPRLKAMQLVALWQRLQSKLVVADAIRRGSLKSQLKASASELRIKIDRLRIAIESGSTQEELKSVCDETRLAAMNCRKTLD